jgi:very-short-patch-repair endonuclease
MRARGRNLSKETKRSCLEEKMSKILIPLSRELDFDYDPRMNEQVPTKSGFVLDFRIYFRGKEVVIETDGAMFHSSSSRKKRDRFRDHLLRKGGAYTVLRFGENFTYDEVKQRLEALE